LVDDRTASLCGQTLPEMAGAEKLLGAPEKASRLGKASRIVGGLGFLRTSRMTHHDCCYYKCEQRGAVFIGANGNPDTDWICAYHRDKWNADRSRFIEDGLPCQMKEL
jgi:hypothetical protein